jgi:hypothetical protein
MLVKPNMDFSAKSFETVNFLHGDQSLMKSTPAEKYQPGGMTRGVAS